ncbi:M20 family metallopeptidase [[Eubacterium] cellulosolvens]
MGEYENTLLQKLVEIDTNVETKTGYQDIIKTLTLESEKVGLPYKVYDAKQESGQNASFPSIVIEYDAHAPLTVLLAAHYDTVPPGEGWKHDPLKLTIEGEKAYGRGACDDKGDIAAALGALKYLKEKGGSKYNVLFAITPEEEVGGDLGLGYLIRNDLIKGDWGIVLDSTPLSVGIGASGVVWGKITFTGAQGHAAFPHKLKNPIDLALPVLNDLRKFSKVRERIRSRLPAQRGSPFKNVWGRFTFTMVNAGIKENVIPQQCEARFDMRICPEESLNSAKMGLKKYFTKLIRRHKIKGSLKFLNGWSSYHTDLHHPLVKRFTFAVEKTTGKKVETIGLLVANDGRFFAAKKIPTVSFGVLREECRYHGIDEFVYLKDIELVKNILVNFFTSS